MLAAEKNTEDSPVTEELTKAMFKSLRMHFEQATFDPHLNPLEWWGKQTFFSPLFPVAKELLAIPATSVPSERVFSCASFLKQASRASMTPSVLEQMVIIRCFSQTKYFSMENIVRKISEMIAEQQD